MVLPSHPWAPRALARWLQSATAPVVSLGYVGLMVMATRTRIWKAIPAVLAPVGQMAFTNYLTQSILMTTLLYGGRGPGLYGKVDRPFLAGAVAVIWLLQILWSRWWMARFTMGPLEWLWRLAYRGPCRCAARPRRRGRLSPDLGGRPGIEEGVERGVDHRHGHRVAQALGFGLADAGGGVAGDLGQVGLALHQVLELGLAQLAGRQLAGPELQIDLGLVEGGLGHGLHLAE
jgi:hypothetical protein